MNKKVQIFNFESSPVRVIEIDNEPWFVGKDVAETLGYKNTKKALGDHVDEEDKNRVTIRYGITRGNPNKTIINESGLYSLILSSKLPTAKKFKRWVTSEVLPTIRKHGMYANEKTVDQMLADPDSMIRVLTELKKERESRLIAEQRINELTPKASYYDLVLKNKSLVTITQIAKDYGISGREMNAKLHDLKVQYKQGSTWLLYSEYQKTGWTQSETIMVWRKDGSQKAVLQTKWTQKGRLGLYELLKKNGTLPLIEREDIE